MLKHLFDVEYVNVWTYDHLYMTMDVLSYFQGHKFLKDVINSVCARNIFYALPEYQRQYFVDNALNQFSYSEESKKFAFEALNSKPYSPYLLLNLIEKETFRKMNDFTLYEDLVKQMNQEDLEYLSTNNQNKERFMNFLRFVHLLNENDQRKKQGQKLIDKIFQIESFKTYQGNQSALQIFENESRVWEEEGVEEAAGNIHVNNVDAHNRVQIKDINFDALFNAFAEGDSTAAINFFKTYKLSDIFFIRGSTQEYATIHSVSEEA